MDLTILVCMIISMLAFVHCVLHYDPFSILKPLILKAWVVILALMGLIGFLVKHNVM